MNLNLVGLPRLEWLPVIGILALGSFAEGCAPSSENETPPLPPAEETRATIRPGAAVNATLRGGETHSYEIELVTGTYLHAIALQDGVDLRLRFDEPGGRTVMVVDSPNGRRGPEPVETLAERTGRYRLALTSQDEPTSEGRYKLWIETLRPAVGADETRAQAARFFANAEEDRRRGDRASLERAVERYDEARTLFLALGESSRRVAALQRLNQVFVDLGQQDAAQISLERALRLLETFSDEKREAEVLNGLGLIHYQKRDHEKARELYLTALKLARSAENPDAEAAVLNNLAELHKRQGRYFEAVELFEQALERWRALGNAEQQAVTLSNLGGIYLSLFEIDRARGFFERSLELIRRLGNRRREALTLNNLGVLFDYAEEDEGAMECFLDVLEIWEELEERGRMAQALGNIGRLQRQQGAFDDAEETYTRAIELARAAGNPDVEAVSLHNRGWLRVARGQPTSALQDYQSAHQLFDKLSPRRRATTIYGTARALRAQGKLADAQATIEEALEIVREVREGIAGRELQSAYFATRHEIYEAYVDLLFERGATSGGPFEARAFEASQEARARGFLDSLAEARAQVRSGADAGLLAEERRLQAEINRHDYERRARMDRGESTEDLAKLVREQDERLSRLDRLRARIRLSTPQSASWIEPAGIEDVQRRILDEATLLLHYELAARRSFVWAITADSLHGFELPGEPEIETAALLAARQFARSYQHTAQGPTRLAAARLSALILSPVEALLGDKRLVIVAEGALEYVPFAALPLPSTLDTTPRLLVERHEIVRLPAASVVAGLRRPAAPEPGPGLVAAVADPVFQADDPRIAATARVPPTGAEPPAPQPPLEGGLAEGLYGFRRLPGSADEIDALLRWVDPKRALRRPSCSPGWRGGRCRPLPSSWSPSPVCFFGCTLAADSADSRRRSKRWLALCTGWWQAAVTTWRSRHPPCAPSSKCACG